MTSSNRVTSVTRDVIESWIALVLKHLLDHGGIRSAVREGNPEVRILAVNLVGVPSFTELPIP